MYLNKKVLVAGGTGTIGVPLVKELLKRGAVVRVASLDAEGVARERLGREIEYLQLDLTEKENCRSSVSGCDYVFNLLGIKGSVGIGETKVASYLVPMLRFQTNLMESAFEAVVDRFLFVGRVSQQG